MAESDETTAETEPRPGEAAVVGCGVIGAAWAARMRLSGVNVHVYDPSPNAERVLAEVFANALDAWNGLGLDTSTLGTLTVHDTIAGAVTGRRWIQESVPERPDIKRSTYAEIEAAAPVDALIGSSTSGIKPSDLQAELNHPERLTVAHPFNPVYLLPLVEICGGSQTSAATIDRAKAWYEAIGMHPLHVRVEIDAFIADRLLEAVWRESLWLVHDGIATTEEIDDAIRYGFGLRWAQMGLFETYRIAGGEGGVRHFLGQFGETLSWPWTKLMDTPDLDDELMDTITEQSDAQSGMHSIRDLERIRDRNLVAMMRALEANAWGAGESVAKLRRQVGSTD